MEANLIAEIKNAAGLLLTSCDSVKIPTVTLPLGTASLDRRRYAARFSWVASQARSNCIGLT